MSRIGNYVLELQEQANELGFSTVQEALDNGYEDANGTLVKRDASTELEQAHQAWVKKRGAILGDLNNLMLGMAVSGKTVENSTDLAVVHRAFRFIKEDCNDR